MDSNVEKLLQAVRIRLSELRKYRKQYNKEIAFDFDPIRRFWGLYENPSSSILAFFLDPEETHAQGDVFLRAFLNLLGLNSLYTSEPISSVYVKRERVFDEGRPDIFISLGQPVNFYIAVEVKIHAYDQEKQIERYNQICNNSKQQYQVVYLTSNGDEPSLSSFPRKAGTKMPEWLKLISWKDDINGLLDIWISLCHAERVRYFLKDFQQAIRNELMGGLGMGETNAVAEQISSTADAFESALAIFHSIDAAKDAIRNKYIHTLAERTGLSLTCPAGNGKQNNPYILWRPSWSHYNIEFVTEENKFIEMEYGVAYVEDKEKREPSIDKLGESIIFNNLSGGDLGKCNNKGDCYAYFEKLSSDWKDWESEENLVKMIAGEKSDLFIYLHGIIEVLLPLIDKAEAAIKPAE